MTEDEEIEDLLGQPKTSRSQYFAKVAEKKGQIALPDSDTLGGVTVFWLAKQFGMEVSTVRKRLADCPWVGKKTSGYLYSLKVAAPYLVKPRIDIKAYLDQMKPGDLPQQLQPAYWEANLKRQKFELSMGQLWETADVMDVFAEVFKAVKFSVQLWPDTLERESGLSDEDRKTLVILADALQDQIYQSILRMTKEKTHPNALVRFNQALEDKTPVVFHDDEEEDIL